MALKVPTPNPAGKYVRQLTAVTNKTMNRIKLLIAAANKKSDLLALRAQIDLELKKLDKLIFFCQSRLLKGQL